MIDSHAAAILALLDTDNANPPLVVLDGINTDPVTRKSLGPPYVLAYFDAGWNDLSFRGRSHTFSLGITCHSVGGSARAARIVHDRVEAALLDVAPVVAGRSCYPIRWESGTPASRDESTGTPVFDQVDVYVLRSLPA